ncbi:MAG: pentapeptide repeat-containing protein [Pseudomonadota bacterium]
MATTLARFRRNYLWFLFVVAGGVYIYTFVNITWPLRWIVDDILELLSSEAADTFSSSDKLRNYAYAVGALLTAFVVLATLPIALIKTWINERQTRNTEQGHITDRLNKAIEMLGTEKTVSFLARRVAYNIQVDGRMVHDGFTQRWDEVKDFSDRLPAELRSLSVEEQSKSLELGDWNSVSETVPNLEVRLGAIYALERIAQDSERDHITVMEVLCAYLRENAPASAAEDHGLGDWPDWIENASEEQRAARDQEIRERRGGFDADNNHVESKLSNWVATRTEPRVDIQAAITVIGRRGPDQTAYEHAPKRDFKLNLRNTNLRRADLSKLDLRRALLTGARMEGADLSGARMEGANLFGARLEGADLSGADLKSADLNRCTIARTRLRSADFTEAKNLSQDAVNAAFGDITTKLPEGLGTHDHWDDQKLEERYGPDEQYDAWIAAGAPPGRVAADEG